jgi:hypothetical protein
MHHNIVIKVYGADDDEARNIAFDTLEDSLTPSHNTVGWSYVSQDSLLLITKDQLQPEYGVTTYADLKQKMIQEQKMSLDNLIAQLQADLLPMIASIFLTKDEAPLLINTENDALKAYIEKLMKRKRDVVRPTTFEGIANAFLKIIVSIAKKDTGHSLAMWRLEQIKKMQACIDFPKDISYTLQCTENHYAELPYDDKKGMHPYFYHADRHF